MPTYAPTINYIEITNATTLAYNRTLETFGSNITFKIVDEITLSLLVYNMSNNGTIITEISQLFDLQNSDDWANLSINNDPIPWGPAKLTSFSIPGGNFAKTATCQVTFIINRTGDDLTNLSGNYFENYKESFTENGPFVDSISESTDLAIGENTISYNKQISIKFSKSLQTTTSRGGSVLQAAQNFAKKVFASDSENSYTTIPVYGIEANINGLLNSGYRKLHSETINSITNECSFTESIQASNVVGDYAHSATQEISIDRLGIATVREAGIVKGLTKPVLTSAQTGYDTEKANAKQRVSDLFDRISDCGNLNTTDGTTDASTIRFISESRTIRQEEGIIEYEVSANNDPKNDSGTSDVIYERTITISKESGYETAEESGTITGMSKIKFDSRYSGINKYIKYLQAKSFFVSAPIIGGIRDRLVAEVAGICTHPVSRNETHSFFQGRISYTHVYSSAPEYQDNEDYKTFSVSERTDKATQKFNEFGIINEGVIIQDLQGKTQGNASTSVNIVGYRVNPETDKIGQTRDNLLDFAKAKVTPPALDDGHLNSANYSFSHYNEVRINLGVSYITELEEASE